MKRIHIVGVSPRSGTTLLAELMNACFEIDLWEEHEAPLFATPPGPGNIYLTKRPRDVMVVGPRLRVDPNLWVLCMIRGPAGHHRQQAWAGSGTLLGGAEFLEDLRTGRAPAGPSSPFSDPPLRGSGRRSGRHSGFADRAAAVSDLTSAIQRLSPGRPAVRPLAPGARLAQTDRRPKRRSMAQASSTRRRSASPPRLDHRGSDPAWLREGRGLGIPARWSGARYQPQSSARPVHLAPPLEAPPRSLPRGGEDAVPAVEEPPAMSSAG